MIIALANQPGTATSLLANLAVLRAADGRKVLLADIHPKRHAGDWGDARQRAAVTPWLAVRAMAAVRLPEEIARIDKNFSDILIDTDGRDSPASRAAYQLADLVIVPLPPAVAALDWQHQLIASLNLASLNSTHGGRRQRRLLFVLMADQTGPCAAQMAAGLAYLSRLSCLPGIDATLAEAVIRAPGGDAYGPGRCVSDAQTCDPEHAAEMHALYRQAFELEAACA